MVHCTDFFKKWQSEPNFCGMSPQPVKRIDKYLNYIQSLEGYGIDQESIFKLLPMSCLFSTRILKLKPSSSIRKEAERMIITALLNKQKIRTTAIRKITNKISELPDEDLSNHLEGGTTEVIKFIEMRNKLQLEIKLDKISEVKRFSDFLSQDGTSLRIRNQSLSKTITPGQRNILMAMISRGFGNDEYTAFCIAIKWASERLEGDV